jgi:exopolysaccharide production protein ExoZ
MRGNVASIQFLRFVAATLVALFHSTQAVNKYFADSISNSITKFTDLGASGVHIFFVISGFIMIYTSFGGPSESFSATKFLTKRAIRIYPIYFVYSALYLLFYHFFATGGNLSFGQLLGSILLIPGYSSFIIGPGWTLSYEVYFYACFAIAMLLGMTRGILALSLFFITAIIFRFLVDTNQPVLHVMTSTLLVEFLFGAWIGYAVVSNVHFSNSVANLMLALSAVGFIVGVGFTHLPSIITWGIPSALLVAGFVFKESNGRVPSLIKKCSFLGDSSYSLYLLHIMLIDAAILLALHLDSSIGTHITLIGGVGMTIVSLAISVYCVVVALISYEFIERTVVGRLQNLYRRKLTATPEIVHPQ